MIGKFNVANTTFVTLKRISYHDEIDTYIFPDSNFYTRKTTQVWPVCMLVFECGDSIK